jgi:hypothetical protein
LFVPIENPLFAMRKEARLCNLFYINPYIISKVEKGKPFLFYLDIGNWSSA